MPQKPLLYNDGGKNYLSEYIHNYFSKYIHWYFHTGDTKPLWTIQ